MDKNQERLFNQSANAKLLHANEQLIFPLLQQKIDERITCLCQAFKTGGAVSLADVAYITAVKDLLSELEATARYGERANKKLNLHPDIS